jgi:hypothetical protein
VNSTPFSLDLKPTAHPALEVREQVENVEQAIPLIRNTSPDLADPAQEAPEFEGSVNVFFCVDFKPSLINLGAEATRKAR